MNAQEHSHLEMSAKVAVWAAWFLVFSLAFRTALVSVSKVILLLAVTGAALAWLCSREDRAPRSRAAIPLVAVTCVCLTALGLSAFWTPVSLDVAAAAWLKLSKLLIPVLLVVALARQTDAKKAWGVMFALHAGVILLTWWIAALGRPAFLGAGHPANLPTQAPAPFTSYLDQGLMHAVIGACAWQLRDLWSSQLRWSRPAMVALAAASLFSCFLLPGRSGHLVALVMIALALWWSMPRRLRFTAVLLPPVVLALVLAASPRQLDRAQLAVTEAKAFNAQGKANSSIGERLHYWTTSVELIAHKPFLGHGLGAWNHAYVQLTQGRPAPAHSAGIRNPHQEYLLWGVQMGLLGVFLLMGWFVSLIRIAARYPEPVRRAAWSVLAALATACFFNSIIWDALIGDFFLAVLGLALALGSCEAEKGRAT